MGVHTRNSISYGNYSIVVLRYSDFSISTTDEYAKPISTHEYSRHFLASALFQYSLDEYLH